MPLQYRAQNEAQVCAGEKWTRKMTNPRRQGRSSLMTSASGYAHVSEPRGAKRGDEGARDASGT